MTYKLLSGLVAGWAAAVVIAAAPAAATTLLSFDGTHGAFPNAGLLAGPDGVLYGTATGGGPSQDLSVGGVAFSLRRSGTGWTQTILHQFGRVATDGSTPHSTLLAGPDGALYGTTFGGGRGDQGTVYRLTPPGQGGSTWQETVLYRFTGAADGANPLSNLVFDAFGRLYGTASQGGTGGLGTVYRLTAPASGVGGWTLKLLHSFAGPDGGAPHAGLVARTAGGSITLFGTTSAGGPAGQGVVFALSSSPSAGAPWTYAVLHGFTGAADGGAPQAGLAADRSLNLYGTTSLGGAAAVGTPGGVVFRLVPPSPGGTTWTEQVLHSFGGDQDGQFPLGAPLLEAGGHLFGTSAGATYSQCGTTCGTVFMLTSRDGGKAGPWNEVVLHSFGGTDGALPSAGLAAHQRSDGTLSLFGVTERGGADDLGTVFQITP